MVKKGERSALGYGDQPDGKLRHLHGHGIDVPAIETAISNEPRKQPLSALPPLGKESVRLGSPCEKPPSVLSVLRRRFFLKLPGFDQTRRKER